VECRIPIVGGGTLIAERNVTIEECPVQIVERGVSIVERNAAIAVWGVSIVEWERNELWRKKTPQPREERDCGGMS
jgi:hypothetical protein